MHQYKEILNKDTWEKKLAKYNGITNALTSNVLSMSYNITESRKTQISRRSVVQNSHLKILTETW